MSSVIRPGAVTKRPPAPIPQTEPQYANPEAEKLAEKLTIGRLRAHNAQLKRENEELREQNKHMAETMAYYQRQMAYMAQVTKDNAEMADQLADAEQKVAQYDKLSVALEVTEDKLRKAEAAHAESIKEVNTLMKKVADLTAANRTFASGRDELIAGLGSQAQDLKTENAALKGELLKSQEALNLADAALTDANTQLNHMQDEIRELTHRVEVAETDYRNLESRYEYEMAQAVHNMTDAEQRHRIYDEKMHSDNHALQDQLHAAELRIIELQNMIRASVEQPAVITTPWGNKPITGEGMRFLLDKAIEYHRKFHALEGAHTRLVKRAEGAIYALTDNHFPDKIKLQGE